jgi:hypothetical protein
MAIDMKEYLRVIEAERETPAELRRHVIADQRGTELPLST